MDDSVEKPAKFSYNEASSSTLLETALAMDDTQGTGKSTGATRTKREQIMSFPSCAEWLQTVRNDATREGFIYHINAFCHRTRKTPDELAQLPTDQLKMMVVRYILELKKVAKQTAGKPVRGQMSVNSIAQYLSGVQSFLEYHEKTLPWKKIRSYLPEAVANDLRAYRHEEIHKMLSFGDLRDRLTVLLMASSGMRVGALPMLKIKHLVKLPEERYGGIGMIKVYSESKRYRYITFVTPECMAIISQYLESRKKMFEKLTEDSPLIRDKFALLSNRTNKPRAIKRRAIHNQIVEMVKRAGLPLDLLQPDHGLRKFFNTAAKNSGIDHMYKEMFMGYTLKLDGVYYDADDPSSIEKIADEYKKAVDALTMNEEYRLKKQVAVLTKRHEQVLDVVQENYSRQMEELMQRQDRQEQVIAHLTHMMKEYVKNGGARREAILEIPDMVSAYLEDEKERVKKGQGNHITNAQ